MDVEYYLNGQNFKDFGVYVSGSKGIVDKLERKQPVSFSWDNYNGDVVDLRNVRYESRKIELVCFIESFGKNDFITRLNTFMSLLDQAGTQRLHIEAVANKPLVYEVYCVDSVAVSKEWDDDHMVGTFTLKLIEPDPVKRVIKGNGSTIISMNCNSLLTIFWGDGTRSDNLYGNISVSHNTNGYIIIAGNIDQITNFSTNGTVIWNKLM